MTIRITNTQTGVTAAPTPGDAKSIPLAIWDLIDRPQAELSNANKGESK